MQKIDEQLQNLTQVYGAEVLLNACRNLIDKNGDKQEITLKVEHSTLPEIPKQYQLLYSEQLMTTVDDLLISANLLMELTQEHYERKAELVKRLKLIEVEIQLKEAEAFMNACDGQAIVDGKTIKLANAEMRDAYRRHYSADLRKQRAEIEAELAELEMLITAGKEQRENATLAAECQMKKANVQTALLNFLGRGLV